MNAVTRTKSTRNVKTLITTILLLALSHVSVSLATDDASRLREKYQSLSQQLQHNQFQRELYLNSVESSSRIKGDIYAVLNYPFATVNNSLNDSKSGPSKWCDVLILHVNTKYCRASTNSNGPILDMYIGKKVEQELVDAYHLEFNYRGIATTKDYFQVDLNADGGPLGTKDYQIVLEAVAINEKQTFIHLTYGYGYGLAGRMAMKTYLNTVGSGKVGFSKMEAVDTGKPSSQDAPEQYVAGVRGLVERNTMRYYLAIDSYLSALTTPPEQRLDQRLTNWFSATELYPTQLHEVDRQAYVQMKHKEYDRQQVAQ